MLIKLRERGFSEQPLARSPQVRAAIRDRNDAYLRRSQKTLINGAHVPRSQAAAIAEKLTTGEHSLLVAGSAGEGKTCLLAQVVGHLQDAGVPLLALSMDELEGVFSSAVLGHGMDLPTSPATVLGQFSAGRRAVLCIDQLDAISFVSGRNAQGQKLLDELVVQVSRYPQLRMLLACRSFDLDGDNSLSDLVHGDSPVVRRIDVEIFSIEDVLGALAAAGIAEAELDESQTELLRVPLHLYLFLGGGTNRGRFGTRQDLFDRYWEEKRRRVDDIVGEGAFVAAVKSLSDLLSTRQRLHAPRRDLTGQEAALDAMASEAVISIQDGSVRFFHDSFFDYAFATTFLTDGTEPVAWLTRDEQPLFRRPQVRQVLAFLREPASDPDRYLQTLKDLMSDVGVRFHIKKLVLDWIGELPRPTPDEWRILEGLPPEVRPHVWSAISNSVPWFDLLQSLGRFDSWLAADNDETDRAVMLLQTPEVLDGRPAEVARLVGPFRGKSDAWRERLWWIARREEGYDIPEMQELLLSLVADGTLDDAVSGAFAERSLWFVLYGLSTRAPTFAAEVLGAWFDRQLERASELGHDNPFDDEMESVNGIQGSEHALDECAKLAPLDFVGELYPKLASLDRTRPPQLIYAPGTDHGGLREHLHEALAEAMSSLAEEDPAALNSIMEAASPERTDCSRWMSALVLRAWSANPNSFAERIVSFLLEHPDERLQLGYDVSTWGTDSFVAVSRNALVAAAPACSHESFTALERTILGFTPDWEQESPPTGRTELALLRALPEGRTSETTRKRIQDLEIQHPDARERGAPEPPKERGFGVVGSPISAEDWSHMTAHEQLSAMARYHSTGPSWDGDQVVGGSRELSRQIEAATLEDSDRYVSLAHRMDSSSPPIYFEAILSGLTRRESDAGTLEQACSVLRRITELGVSVSGGDIARAIEELADEDLPDDIIEMLCRIALNDPDPASDTWQEPGSSFGSPGAEAITQAINSSRGTAAMAIARLLFADDRRWHRLKSTVDVVITDHVLAVRAVGVRCLLAILDSNRSDALAGFGRLTEDADAILATSYVEEFMQYAVFRDYAAVSPVIEKMLSGKSPDMVRIGARLVASAALRVDEAREDGRPLLAMGEETRAGAAEVYAGNLASETVGAECERHLQGLFDDESQEVRQAASNCWHRLAPDELARKGALIGTFARSRSFNEHSAGMLAHCLERIQQRPPIEVCDLAERAVAEFGDRVTSIQFAEAGVAYTLSKLVVRLLRETEDAASKRRILNVIDGMQRAGFLGINERLKGQDDR